LAAIRGKTEGLKVAASTPPTTLIEATRPQRGTFGLSGHARANATATSIGPTNHPAGIPIYCANNPISTELRPRSIHPRIVLAADDLLVIVAFSPVCLRHRVRDYQRTVGFTHPTGLAPSCLKNRTNEDSRNSEGSPSVSFNAA